MYVKVKATNRQYQCEEQPDICKMKLFYFKLLGHVTYTYRNFQLLRVKSLYWYMLHD